MVAVPAAMRKACRSLLALGLLLFLAACDSAILPVDPPRIFGERPVRVALLVPQSEPGAAPIARSLENAARLAIAQNAERQPMDLRVYDTAGRPELAAERAREAVADGAQVILGPLFGEAANAAGLAVADSGVSVLSFSNNAGIAGGNVFILGQTFRNTADRLTRFASARGRQAMVIVHPESVSGRVGRVAIEQAAAGTGLRVVSAEGYALSDEGVIAAARRANASVQGGADTVFITTDATNRALPTLLQMLPENGMPPGEIQYIGLTRWDVRPDLATFPGAEGAWFAVPDEIRLSRFASDYTDAYGTSPHPLAGLAHDGISAVASLVGGGGGLSRADLTRAQGFVGANGRFRLRGDGTNRRALAVATIRDRRVTILDPAPLSFEGSGL